MSERADRAVGLFKEGYSCSQAVAAVFSEQYGLDETTAMKAAGCFGAGMQAAEVCGAVSGALMVIGLKDGCTDPKDKAAKFYALGRAAEFIRLFRERHGAVTCRDLLGCDVMTSEGKGRAVSEKLFVTRCRPAVFSAVGILEEMGY